MNSLDASSVIMKNVYTEHVFKSRNGCPDSWSWNPMGHLLAHELGHSFDYGHDQSCANLMKSLDSIPGSNYIKPALLGLMHKGLALKSIRKYIKDCPYSTSPLSITLDEEWDFDIRLYRDLIIEPGAELTIKCKVSMPDSAKIIVKRGARLTIDGGTITCACDGMWEGIEVWGNSSKSHPTVGLIISGSYPSNADDQGVLYMKNGAIIENERNAVTMVRKQTWGNDLQYAGGIIIAKNSFFRNNGRAVAFLQYTKDDNISYFKEDTFEVTGTLQDPNKKVIPFVTLWDVHGVRFMGNMFRNTAASGAFKTEEKGTGIYSEDADYKVTGICTTAAYPCTGYQPNTFENLYRGIEAYSIASLATKYPILIDRNDFVKNFRGVILRATDHVRIIRNKFDVGPAANPAVPGEGTTSYGLYLQGCDAYQVEDNEFTTSYGGMISAYVWNSGDNDNMIYNNTFHDVGYGTYTSRNNIGLQIKCNQFTDIGYNNITVTSGAVKKDQGFCFGSYTDPAGNTFTITCNNDEHFYANTGVNDVTGGITYHHHSNKPPVCYSTSVITRNDCGYPYNTNDCSSHLGFGGGPCDGQACALVISNLAGEIELKQDTLNGASGDDSTRLTEEIGYLHSKRQIYINELIRQYLDSGEVDSAIMFLEAEDTMNASMMLVPILLRKGDTLKAEQHLNKIPRDSLERTEFCRLHTISLNLLKSGQSYPDMDSTQEQSIRDIAAKNTRPAIQAQNILRFVFGEYTPEIIEEDSSSKRSPRNERLINNNRLDRALLDLFPNPMADHLTILYNLPKSALIAEITIYDQLGRVMKNKYLSGKQHKAQLDVSTLNTGLYILRMNINGRPVANRKIVIFK